MKIIGCNNASGVDELGLKQNIEFLLKHYPEHTIEKVQEPTYEVDYTNPLLKNLETVYQVNQALATACDKALSEGHSLINIIGDHSTGIATVAASAKQCNELGVIWIDAHSDINTEETTPSGNIHGMTISHLLNITNNKLNNILFDGPKMKPEHIVYIGLRDVDPGEKEWIEKLGICFFDERKIQELGLDEVLQQTLIRLQACDRVHVSLDMDSMNPHEFPAVSVPVKNGFTPAEVHKLLQELIQNLPVLAVDLTEYNPEYDVDFKGLAILNDLIKQIGGLYETQS